MIERQAAPSAHLRENSPPAELKGQFRAPETPRGVVSYATSDTPVHVFNTDICGPTDTIGLVIYVTLIIRNILAIPEVGCNGTQILGRPGLDQTCPRRLRQRRERPSSPLNNRGSSRGGVVADPLYRRIADDLRSQIETGQLARGKQLPPEAELSDLFRASRNTIRDAIKFLISLGLVETRAGQGTFVVDPPDPLVTTLTSDQPGLGVVRVLPTRQRPASAILAARFLPSNSRPHWARSRPGWASRKARRW